MTTTDELEERVQRLASGVGNLSEALRAVGVALQEDVQALREEVEVQRRLSKYARRTWFEMMTYIFFVGLLVSDVAREYCLPDDSGRARFPEACDTVFWTTDHGGGWGWRLLGFCLLAALMLWMGRRSQVPDDLFHRTPAGLRKRG